MNLQKIPAAQRVALADVVKLEPQRNNSKFVTGYTFLEGDIIGIEDAVAFENGDIQAQLRLTVESDNIRLPDQNRHWPGHHHWAAQLWFIRVSAHEEIPEMWWPARMRHWAREILTKALQGCGDVTRTHICRTKVCNYYFKALTQEEEKHL